MAVKKIKSKVSENKPKEEPVSIKTEKKMSKWAGAGWVLLLLGGLAHMLPEQMSPLMKWSLFGISIQLAVGVVSVILALNFLLEE